MKMNLKEVYYFTAKVLGLAIVSDNNKKKYKDSIDITEVIKRGNVNWQGVIEFASNHVMLPSIYLKLKDHELIEFLPEGLADHLRYILGLSLERNMKIINNMGEVNTIFLSGGITPLFLKGSGNIADNLYTSPGERLMADIDILVHPDRVEDAAALLKENGFFSHTGINMKFISSKHYTPLVKEGWPAFIEIHRMPVKFLYRSAFTYEMAVEGCRPAKGNPVIMVMSDSNKMIMNFIHTQLEHGGHYSGRPPLRDLYDLLLLSRRVDPQVAFSALLSKPPFPKLFLKHTSSIPKDSISETTPAGSNTGLKYGSTSFDSNTNVSSPDSTNIGARFTSTTTSTTTSTNNSNF